MKNCHSGGYGPVAIMVASAITLMSKAHWISWIYFEMKIRKGGGRMKEKADDYQVGGTHYKSLQVTPWDAMQAWMTAEQFQGFLLGNAIKYLSRDKGNKVEDVKKAQHYLTKWVEVASEND